MSENRKQKVISSLSMLKQPKNDTEKYFALLAKGLVDDF